MGTADNRLTGESAEPSCKGSVFEVFMTKTSRGWRCSPVPLSACRWADIQTVNDYWEEKRTGRVAPSWKDLNLMDLPSKIIPRIMVADVFSDPYDLRVRFWGTLLATAYNREITNKHLAEIKPQGCFLVFVEPVEEMRKTMAPHILSLECEAEHHTINDMTLFQAPLSDDGETMNGILTLMDFGGSLKAVKDLHKNRPG